MGTLIIDKQGRPIHVLGEIRGQIPNASLRHKYRLPAQVLDLLEETAIDHPRALGTHEQRVVESGVLSIQPVPVKRQ